MATATMAAFQAMRISPVNAAVTSNTTSSVNSRVTLNSALQTVSCSRVGFSASGLFASRIASKKPTHQTVETRSVTVVAEKKYKVKTHKASAKRFRVTGSGKVVRRQAWRAHLLQKKSLRRKNRLAGMTGVFRGDLDKVVGALPYLKVNRRRLPNIEVVEEGEVEE